MEALVCLVILYITIMEALACLVILNITIVEALTCLVVLNITIMEALHTEKMQKKGTSASDLFGDTQHYDYGSSDYGKVAEQREARKQELSTELRISTYEEVERWYISIVCICPVLTAIE